MQPVLEGQNVRLRTASAEDADTRFALGNHSAILRMYGIGENAERRASMAIGIFDPACLGTGLGSEVIGLVLRHAFATLRLHRISIRVLAFNRRAIRAYEKSGFVEEGSERETAFIDGAWHDDVMMGILDREFAVSQ
ncbi:GNAT family N-acetyltransferase [Rhizobium sp. ARZ01]|uniref:GNAT family N-acetyltransferase n=1 Tax=Rhizobium sp. ARZ01 TaxID=2769313 RepID=UPI00177CE6D6|nr:GNAT family protein [Rhizobium sp. ARZ01]MBD9373102.1 GNAT family N-acetyltransferase [Rhizobium sp. ARZ01]